jgi:Ca2+-binding RTX toxin-like protein
MATISKNTVIDIYTGILGILPPKDAIDWLTGPDYLGKPLDDANNLVLDAFQKRYTAGVDDANLLTSASNTNFVKAVYARIFGFTASELAAQSEGVNYWTNWLKNPSAGADPTNNSRGSLISTMLDVALDKSQYVDNAVVEKARNLLANRETVANYYLQKNGTETDQTWLRKVIGDVTQDASSVDAAKVLIDGKTPDDGGAANVVLKGTEGNDFLSVPWDSSDNYTINGLGGDDWLIGGTGNDILNGGAGDDFLSGNQGDDTLNGGQGNDGYSFTGVGSVGLNPASQSLGHDTIYDESGEDIISIYAPANKTLSFKHSGNDFILTLTPAAGVQTVITIKDFYNGHAVEWLDFFNPDNPASGAEPATAINLVGVANSVADGATLTPSNLLADLPWAVPDSSVYDVIYNG